MAALRVCLILLALFGLSICVSFGQMSGGCGDYGADLRSELRLMGGALAKISAAGDVAAAPQIEPGKAYAVDLLPQAQVHFPVPPKQDRGGDGRSAGMLSLGNLAAGSWRVSTDSPVWIDLLAGGKAVTSSGFEMKTECPAILKTVVFAVPGGVPVLLQINGAPQHSVRLLVTAVSAAR